MNFKPTPTLAADIDGGWQRYALTLLACTAMAALGSLLIGWLDQANIVMLFLLTVLIVAVKLGRRAAVLASLTSVVLFDVFFVPPRFSLAVSDIQYLVTFAVMLATALTTTHFTSVLRQKAQEAERREARTRALYQLARELAGALTRPQVGELARQFVRAQLQAHVGVFLPDEQGHRLRPLDEVPPIQAQLAQMALESGQRVRDDEVGALGVASLYLPLKAAMRIRGVLAVRPLEDEKLDEATISLLEALASLLAVALERLHYAEVAQATEVRMLTERLRSSILSALSHDLRTPLTAMVGLADSLFLIKPPLPVPALETAQALHEQAARLAGLVSNLLDMARLNAGQVTLRREWQPLEEVVGASLNLLAPALVHHRLRVALADDLPLLQFDAVLMERVFCNLLENAAKYAPPGSTIELVARPAAGFAEIQVLDQGPGFGRVETATLFEMFTRGQTETTQPGTGLGLAICRAIVEAHGGRIQARNRAEGGACLSLTLPLGNPPVIEEEAP